MVVVRPATLFDADQMVEIINVIIRQGGTTAHQTPFDRDRMVHHYIQPENIISCMVACDAGLIVGFQSMSWVEQSPEGTSALPGDWADIGTFVQRGKTGNGIGSALFAETRRAAKSAGVAVIHAQIRADNIGGLAYYRKTGFVDFDVVHDVPLRDGSRVDRIKTRYEIL